MKVKHSRFSVGVILFALAMLPTMAQKEQPKFGKNC